TATATPAKARKTAASSQRRAVGRRSSHSLTVVATTWPHDGSDRGEVAGRCLLLTHIRHPQLPRGAAVNARHENIRTREDQPVWLISHYIRRRRGLLRAAWAWTGRASVRTAAG